MTEPVAKYIVNRRPMQSNNNDPRLWALCQVMQGSRQIADAAEADYLFYRGQALRQRAIPVDALVRLCAGLRWNVESSWVRALAGTADFLRGASVGVERSGICLAGVQAGNHGTPLAAIAHYPLLS